MGLFKNLYLDLGFLNPFKKKSEESNENMFSYNNPPAPKREFKDLPSVPKRLIDKEVSEKTETISLLPKINKKPVMPPPKINGELNPPKFKSEPEPLKPEPPKFEQLTNSNESTYFNQLHTDLANTETAVHNMTGNVLQKDLMKEMQEFWKQKKEELDNTAVSNAVKSNLLKKMEELQQLELTWQQLQLQQEKTKDELFSKEIIIESKIKDIRNTFKKLHFNSAVEPHHEFVLSNGMHINNLQQLADELKSMDRTVYNNHVNDKKNDFSCWVKDVMGLEKLAKNLKSAQSKEHMSRLIETWYASN
jgi:hypothetical protein